MTAIDDPALPHLADLLDPEQAQEVLRAALATDAVADVKVSSVSYRPGSRAIVRYRLTIEGESASATAMTGSRLPDGGVRLTDGSGEVAVWRFPDDPGLPGLAVVLDPPALGELLGGLGVPGERGTVRLRAYRPGRRAVVEIVVGGRRMFAKIVRPKRVAELQAIHAALSDTVPVPRSLGWQPDLGIVVLEAIPGTPISTALGSGVARDVAGPDEMLALLDLIAACDVPARRRTPPAGRAPDHAATLKAVMPGNAMMLDEVAAAAADAPEEPTVTAHRDFHASQMLVHEGRLRLVDIDTVGPGTRADDLGMLLAQLTCLARPGPRATLIAEYRDALRDRFTEVVEPGSLDVRTAAAILGFAIGPFRVQEAGWEEEVGRRIEAATSLLKNRP